MKEIIFALLTWLLAPHCLLQAQYEDLLNDRNISWVAEYTADFMLDPVSCDFNFDAYNFNNDLNVIQLNIPLASGGLSQRRNLAYYFSQKILDGIRRGAYSFFEDEQLEIPLSKEKVLAMFSPLDTVLTFDPETYEEKTTVVSAEISWESSVAFRVRQVFYYNKPEKTFGARLLAMAPLKTNLEREGLFDEAKPIVWLKIEAPKNQDKIVLRDVAYSFETRMTGNAPGLQDFVLKKGRMDFLQLIVNEVAKPSRPVLNNDLEPIDPAKLQDYVQSTDTVVTYNPATFEQRIEIVQRNAIKDVKAISFVQHWWYDDRKNLFFNRVVATAPEVAVKDAEGNVRYSKVLFYMMNK